MSKIRSLIIVSVAALLMMALLSAPAMAQSDTPCYGLCDNAPADQPCYGFCGNAAADDPSCHGFCGDYASAPPNQDCGWAWSPEEDDWVWACW